MAIATRSPGFTPWLSIQLAMDATWRWDAAAKKVVVEMTQSQNGAAYRLPMEISLGDRRIEKVEFTQKRQTFEFAAEAEPRSVTLDPNTWVLMNASLTRAK